MIVLGYSKTTKMCPYLLEICTYAYLHIFTDKTIMIYRNCFKITWEKGTESSDIEEIKLDMYKLETE